MLDIGSSKDAHHSIGLPTQELTDFMLAATKFGCDPHKIKMSFSDYFKNFVDSYTANPSVREKLYRIPYIIRPNLDPHEKKMLNMQLYYSAIMRCILNDIIEQKHADFFKQQALEKTQSVSKHALHKKQEHAFMEIELEDYRHNLEAQHKKIDDLTTDALALSIQDKIQFLEQEHTKIFESLSDELYTSLKENGVFDKLKDIHGNAIALSDTDQRVILNDITSDYINQLVDYHIQNQAMAFYQPAPENELKNGGAFIHSYHNNADNLMGNFHHAHGRSVIKNSIENKLAHNIGHSACEKIADHIHNELQNKKTAIREITSNRMQIRQHEIALMHITASKNTIDLEKQHLKDRKNRF